MYGATNFRTGRCHYMVHPRKDAARSCEFLRQLLEAHSDRRVLLVLDDASYHRTRAILDLFEDHGDHAMVVWLPPYSPELNPIEGLWGYLKRSALNNYFFGTVESLERAIVQAFRALNSHPETVLSLAYRNATDLLKRA